MAGLNDQPTAAPATPPDRPGADERVRLAELGAAVGLALTRADTLPDMLDACARSLVSHLDAAFARVWTLNDADDVLELQASAGLYTHLDGPHGRVPVGMYKIGRIAQDREPHLTNAVVGDPRVGDQAWAVREGMVAFAGYPLVVADRLVGVMAVFARHPLSPLTLRAMASVANEIALGIAREKAVADVRRERELFHAMVDTIPQLAWVADPGGAIAWYNRRWYDYTGTTPAAMLGWGWKAVHHPDHLARVVAKFSAAVAAAAEWEDTFPLRSAAGEYRWFLSRAVPVRDAAGRVVRWFGTNTDVEDQRRAEAEAAAARAAAEEANRSKSEFLANMSHELRTPLNAVIMYSELLQEEAQDIGQGDKFGPDLDRIRGAGKHLLSLVNGVLDLSKIEAGKMDLDLEAFDLPAVVAEVVDTVRPLLGKRHNALAVDCPAEVGTVFADATKVRQVLVNLLSNAGKFTEGGTITLTARRSPGPAGEVLTMAVADTGIGMTPEQVGRLFRPFAQADSSTTRKYGGTGLGLTISKSFAELMGGAIAVASEPGGGTTFTLTLPARVAALAGTGEHPALATALALPPGVPVMLVVDADPGVREFMSRELAARGVRPVLAADGDEGLRLARAHRPAAVFLDVVAPRPDAGAVLAALKGDPALAATPVVVMALVGDRDMGYAVGAADCLQKPIDPARLAAALARHRPAPGGRVLVVDDDPATRAVLRRALVRDGWAVDEAEDGRLALDRVRAGVPGLILLDLLMPVMTGFEFVAELRAEPAWDGVPVVVLTSKDLTAEDRRLLAGNVERVIQKGAYSRAALLAEVGRVVAAYGGRVAGANAAPPSPPARTPGPPTASLPPSRP